MRRTPVLLLLAACAGPPRAKPPAPGVASPFAYEHALRAELQAQRGRSSLAVAELRRAVASDPSSTWLRLRLALELERLGRLEEAAAEASAAAVLDARDPQPHLHLAEIAWRRGQLEVAEEALRDALRREPMLAPAYERLVDLEVRRGEAAAAEARLREWVAALPASAEGWCRLGQLSADRAAGTAAAEALRHCLDLDPGRVPSRLRLADLLDAAGDEGAAIAVLRDGLERTRDRVPLLERLLPLLVRAGRGREAAERLDSLEPSVADDGETLVTLGYLYLSARRPQKAESLGREARAREPASPRGALLVADALAARGLREAALAELGRIGPGTPRFTDAQIRVIALLRDEGRLDEALALARRLAKDHPGMAAPFELAATCLLREGDLATALVETREALRREPDRATVLSLLGVIYAEQGTKLDHALALGRRALALRPGSGQVLHDVGWIQFRAGRIDEARRYLERAARAEPGSETIRRHLEQLRALAAAPEPRRR